ncbi:hypothetical protein LguiA_014986 [Lonicera macranthoides]
MADGWNPYQMLDLYIHDYMVKNNMPQTAEIFAREANVSPQHRVAIDVPEGFLNEWWSIFWDMYSARARGNNTEGMAESSSAAPKRMGDELENVFMPEMKRQRIGQSPFNIDIGTMLGQPTPSMLDARVYGEEYHRVPPINLRSNMQLLDLDRQDHIRPSASNASYPHMQISDRPQQRDARVDRDGIGMGISIPTDSTSHGVPPGAIQARPTLRNAGSNNEVGPMPLPRWPSTGVGFGSVSSGMGSQPLNSNFLIPRHQRHQFQTLTAYPQFEEKPRTPLMGISTLRGGPSYLSNRRHPVPEFREKDARCNQNAQHQMMPPSTQIADKQAVVLARKNTQQRQKDLQQQQLDENTRKTKSKSNKSNAPGGEIALRIVVSSFLVATNAEVDKQVDENVESYLSHNEDNADVTSNTFSTLQPSSLNCKKNEFKGFSFKEVGSIHPSTSKVLCCHFSSDGKFLVSAGHEKKVLIWNLDLFQPAKTAEEHSHIITDVRFRPNSTLFATSSFDRTVQIWDATRVNYNPCPISINTFVAFRYRTSRSSKSLLTFVGHGEQVMSLDFHPRKSDLLCSCDSNDEIRLWNVNQSACTSVFKGASRQVRFQPQVGNLLAAASGSAISLIDVETKCVLHKLERPARPQSRNIYPHRFVSGSSRPASQGVTHPGIALVHYSLNFEVLMGSEASESPKATIPPHKGVLLARRASHPSPQGNRRPRQHIVLCGVLSDTICNDPVPPQYDIVRFGLWASATYNPSGPGHSKDIRSICWDKSGNYVASVSEDSARVWSASGGKCMHELNSNGNKFGSCAFHPGYSLLLVIGSYQSLVLWNSTKNNETITVNAHDGIIASLADSPRTEMIASASHDQWVKLWK